MDQLRDGTGIAHVKMNRRSPFHACWTIGAAAVLSVSSVAVSYGASGSVDKVPALVQGTWEVARVAVDGQDTLHALYRKDDPRLLGRELVIDGTQVRFNFGKDATCTQTRWTARQSTWQRLIAKGFPRPPMGGRNATPTLDDFDLTMVKTAAVTVYPLCPSAKQRPDSDFALRMWVAPAGPDQLMFHHDPQMLLILARRPAGALPHPSFACAKATTPVENSICKSFVLAALDRSVSVAWREALARQPGEEGALRAEQREWLRKRDACHTAPDCLEEAMNERIEDLVQR